MTHRPSGDGIECEMITFEIVGAVQRSFCLITCKCTFHHSFPDELILQLCSLMLIVGFLVLKFECLLWKTATLFNSQIRATHRTNSAFRCLRSFVLINGKISKWSEIKEIEVEGASMTELERRRPPRKNEGHGQREFSWIVRRGRSNIAGAYPTHRKGLAAQCGYWEASLPFSVPLCGCYWILLNGLVSLKSDQPPSTLRPRVRTVGMMSAFCYGIEGLNK